MEDARKLSDFIDLDLLQNIQDNCSKAMGLAFITVDYKGIPITKYSGFTSHCMLGRQAKGFAEMCEQCDAHGGLHAAITGQPYIYRCHADLVDFAVPLIVNGSYMGAVLGGQVRLQEESERELEHILPQRPNWKRDKEWEEAYQKLEVVTYEKVEASVKLLRDIIVTFVERRTGKGADGVLREKEKQLSEERAARLDLEKQVQKQESNTARRRTELHYFFFVMNIISKLAYEEKAAKTEAVSCDFADMMRYAAGAEQKISTIGEELNYIGALLRIRKAWVRDKLAYTISVPEQYHQVSCPFMVLQPIVECALEGAETEARIQWASSEIRVLRTENGPAFGITVTVCTVLLVRWKQQVSYIEDLYSLHHAAQVRRQETPLPVAWQRDIPSQEAVQQLEFGQGRPFAYLTAAECSGVSTVQEGGGPAADSPAHRLLLAPVGGAGGGALQKAVFDQQAAEVGKVLIDPAQQPVDLLLRILSAGRELLSDGAEYDQLALLTGRPLAQGAGLVETGGQDGLPLLLSNGVARINHGRSGMGVAKAGIHRAGDAAGAQ